MIGARWRIPLGGLLGCMLAGCATTDGHITPRDALTAAEIAAPLAEAGFEGYCLQHAAVAACSDPKAVQAYAAARALLARSFALAETGLASGAVTDENRAAYVRDAVGALTALEQLVATLRAHGGPEG